MVTSQSQSFSPPGHLRHLINHIIKIIFLDSSVIQGELKGFDKHMNLLLTNCIEIDSGKSKIKQLGFILVRGEQILATSVVSSPLISNEERKLIQKKKLEQIELRLKQEKLDNLKKLEKKKKRSIGGLQISNEKKKKEESKKTKISLSLKPNKSRGKKKAEPKKNK